MKKGITKTKKTKKKTKGEERIHIFSLSLSFFPLFFFYYSLIAHFSNRAIDDMKKSQQTWSQDTVNLGVEWTAVEVLKFEFAMKQYGSDLCVVNEHVRNEKRKETKRKI